MALNLDDIARLAGVSRATVSRVINNHPDVSAATRQKVQDVIDKYHFKPNLAARMLVTQKTHIIGIIISNPTRTFRSYYTSILFQGINDVTYERDYATLIWWQRMAVEKDRFSERILQQKRLMDGMLISSAEIENTLTDRLMEMGVPFVMMERPLHASDRISFVTVDNLQSAEGAVEHLIKLGRRRIAHIIGLPGNADSQDRLTGYRMALEANNIPFDPKLIVDGSFRRESGDVGMRKLLARDIPIDAVFAGNDEIADGALMVLKQNGIRVPEDIALVGFDDVPLAQDSSPSLTTVRQPIYERGAHATTLLLDMIEGKVTEPQQVILPTQLVIRQSCGANPGERT